MGTTTNPLLQTSSEEGREPLDCSEKDKTLITGPSKGSVITISHSQSIHTALLYTQYRNTNKWNARGLLRNCDDVQELLHKHSPKVLCTRNTLETKTHVFPHKPRYLPRGSRWRNRIIRRRGYYIRWKRSVSWFADTNSPRSSGCLCCCLKQTCYYLLSVHLPSIIRCRNKNFSLLWINYLNPSSSLAILMLTALCRVTREVMRKAAWLRTLFFQQMHAF